MLFLIWGIVYVRTKSLPLSFMYAAIGSYIIYGLVPTNDNFLNAGILTMSYVFLTMYMMRRNREKGGGGGQTYHSGSSLSTWWQDQNIRNRYKVR